MFTIVLLNTFDIIHNSFSADLQINCQIYLSENLSQRTRSLRTLMIPIWYTNLRWVFSCNTDRGCINEVL